MTTAVRHPQAAAGGPNRSYVRAECGTCGWRGPLRSTRLVEMQQMADRDAARHTCSTCPAEELLGEPCDECQGDARDDAGAQALDAGYEEFPHDE